MTGDSCLGQTPHALSVYLAILNGTVPLFLSPSLLLHVRSHDLASDLVTSDEARGICLNAPIVISRATHNYWHGARVVV